jgi:phosphoglycolate phosphatase-like HAD superfamily hydrolase
MQCVLLFDIDGTLVRTGGAGKRAVETALMEHFGVTALRDEVAYSGRTDPAILRDVLAVHGLEPTAENIHHFGEQYLTRLPTALKALGGEVCPGVREMLLRIKHKPLGLLTGNVERGARMKLSHFDLWHHFQFGGYGDGVTDRDDVARTALANCRTHHPQVAAKDVWVIGDTPLDVSCARAIGARSVAVATGWHSLAELKATHADLVLETLEDTARLPSEWFA